MILMCSTERADLRQPCPAAGHCEPVSFALAPSAGCRRPSPAHTTARHALEHLPPRHMCPQAVATPSSAVTGAYPGRVLACAPAAVWEWCPWPAPAAEQQPLAACPASHPVQGRAALQACHGGACPAQAASAPGSPAAAAGPGCSQVRQAAVQAGGCVSLLEAGGGGGSGGGGGGRVAGTVSPRW